MLDDAFVAKLFDVHTYLLAVVVDFDAARWTCSAQPIARQARFLETGDRSAKKLPLLIDVPVQFAGGGSAALTFPLAQGDMVVVACAEHSIDAILAYGLTDVDPLQDHRHNLGDGLVVGRVNAFTAAPPGAAGDRVSLGFGGDPEITIRQSDLRLGGDSATAQAMNTDDGAAFMTALAAAITALGPSPAAAALVALQTQLSPPAFGVASWPTGSTKVKVK